MNRLLIGMFVVCVSASLLPAEPGRVSEINQLRAENATLKKKVAALKKQLAQIKKPPIKTTPPVAEKKVEAPNPKLDAFWAAYDDWRKQKQQSLRSRLKNPSWSIHAKKIKQELSAVLRASKLYIAARFEDEVGVGQIAKVGRVTVFQISDANNMLAELPVTHYYGEIIKGPGQARLANTSTGRSRSRSRRRGPLSQIAIFSEGKKVLVWIKGVDTTMLTDAQKARVNRPMAITGTKAYATLGGKSTVFVLEPLDSLPPRAGKP